MSVQIRPATPADLAQVRQIFEYYVLNTVASFLVQKPLPDYIKSRHDANLERKLPYLVAEEISSAKIVGYACASAYRGYMLGYGHTVELTVFCHPEHKGEGIGNKLMGAIIHALKQTKHVSNEAGYEEHRVEFEVKKVLAIMAIDDQGPRGGLALRDWYINWGFEDVGRMKEVGYKNGRL